MMRWGSYALGALNGAAIAAALLVGGYALVSLPAPSATDELAERFGVTIVWDVSHCGGDEAGCFSRFTPDVIYVSPEVRGTQYERDLILHELGHVLQLRAGVAFDECGADAIAKTLGATWLSYADQCSTEPR